MISPVRVVLADDHVAVRSGVAAILGTDPGIEVVAEAENGFDALAACVAHDPDVALIDLRMPGTDGIWATQRITRETRTRVIVLTTYDTDELIGEAFAAGAHGYLLKSTSGAELIQSVHHVAADRHVVDPAIAGGVIKTFAADRASQRTPVPPGPLELGQLTPREREVLRLVVTGASNQAIADELRVSVTTVKTHVGALYAKTGAQSRVELARLGSGADSR